jgi:ribonuclease HI
MSSPEDYHPGTEGVIERRMVFCETLLSTFDTGELLSQCPDCLRFCAYCCQHESSTCHHFALAFTDGSCLNNGQVGATSGLGIAIGSIGIGDDQWSIPVDGSVDSDPRRTSQRAELLAAIEGLRRLCDNSTRGGARHGTRRQAGQCWVIVTDSEYVVKGMTEWVPVWKASQVTLKSSPLASHRAKNK